MSVEAITWALRQHVPRSSAKFVLVVLANCASADTFVAWPSAAYLADATSQDRKTVFANLRKLCASGYIVDVGERKGATKQVVVYQLNCDPRVPASKLSRKRNDSESGTIPKANKDSTNFSPKPSQKRDAEPSGTKMDTTTRGVHAPSVVVMDYINRARVDDQTKQAIRDEFNARMAKHPPDSPNSWLRALVARAERGKFIPDAGLAVATRRNERNAREQETALRRQEAEDRESRSRSPEARAAADAALQELRAKLWGQS